LMNLFNQTSITQDMGGGMIGAVLYAVSYFLFANIGTYLFILLLAFFGIMSIGQFSYQNLFSKIGDGMKIIFDVLKNIFVKYKAVLTENIQYESKESQKRP